MNKLVIGLLLLAPATCFAAQDWAIDVRGFAGGTSVDLSGGGFSFEPRGTDTGVRATVHHASGPFALAEYTYADVDGKLFGNKVDIEFDEFRIGGGYQASITPQLRAGGYGAFVNEQVDFSGSLGPASFDADGFNVGVLAEYDMIPAIQLYGRFGYLNLEPDGGGENSDGVDLNAGLIYQFAAGIATFVEVRYTQLQASGSDLDYSSYRGGIRLNY